MAEEDDSVVRTVPLPAADEEPRTLEPHMRAPSMKLQAAAPVLDKVLAMAAQSSAAAMRVSLPSVQEEDGEQTTKRMPPAIGDMRAEREEEEEDTRTMKRAARTPSALDLDVEVEVTERMAPMGGALPPRAGSDITLEPPRTTPAPPVAKPARRPTQPLAEISMPKRSATLDVTLPLPGAPVLPVATSNATMASPAFAPPGPPPSSRPASTLPPDAMAAAHMGSPMMVSIPTGPPPPVSSRSRPPPAAFPIMHTPPAVMATAPGIAAEVPVSLPMRKRSRAWMAFLLVPPALGAAAFYKYSRPHHPAVVAAVASAPSVVAPTASAPLASSAPVASVAPSAPASVVPAPSSSASGKGRRRHR